MNAEYGSDSTFGLPPTESFDAEDSTRLSIAESQEIIENADNIRFFGRVRGLVSDLVTNTKEFVNEKKLELAFLGGMFVVATGSVCGPGTETATQTPRTPNPTASITSTSEETGTPTVISSETASPTETDTATATETATATITDTATATETPSPTNTETPRPTDTPTETPSPTETATQSPTPTESPTPVEIDPLNREFVLETVDVLKSINWDKYPPFTKEQVIADYIEGPEGISALAEKKAYTDVLAKLSQLSLGVSQDQSAFAINPPEKLIENDRDPNTPNVPGEETDAHLALREKVFEPFLKSLRELYKNDKDKLTLLENMLDDNPGGFWDTDLLKKSPYKEVVSEWLDLPGFSLHDRKAIAGGIMMQFATGDRINLINSWADQACVQYQGAPFQDHIKDAIVVPYATYIYENPDSTDIQKRKAKLYLSMCGVEVK